MSSRGHWTISEEDERDKRDDSVKIGKVALIKNKFQINKEIWQRIEARRESYWIQLPFWWTARSSESGPNLLSRPAMADVLFKRLISPQRHPSNSGCFIQTIKPSSFNDNSPRNPYTISCGIASLSKDLRISSSSHFRIHSTVISVARYVFLDICVLLLDIFILVIKTRDTAQIKIKTHDTSPTSGRAIPATLCWYRGWRIWWLKGLADLVVDKALKVISAYHFKIMKFNREVLLTPDMDTVRNPELTHTLYLSLTHFYVWRFEEGGEVVFEEAGDDSLSFGDQSSRRGSKKLPVRARIEMQ
ncbi:hypothetical protein C8J56DRAFT_883285 [Mycena floridula]|nr:hypothetical protein C8J56DRAFT_883285 [Mycena floridula]